MREYRLSFWRKLANAAMRLALRLGIAPSRYVLLTVPGRRSGQPYSTPVIMLRRNAERFLVAPYGERSWVRNARAAGRVTMSRAGKAETLSIEELSPAEAGPVLKQYVQQTPITRSFFRASPQSPVSDFVDEATHHPVFRLRP